jgi:hypothetical protein
MLGDLFEGTIKRLWIFICFDFLRQVNESFRYNPNGHENAGLAMVAWTGGATRPISSAGGHHVRRHGGGDGGQATGVSERRGRLTKRNRNREIKQINELWHLGS